VLFTIYHLTEVHTLEGNLYDTENASRYLGIPGQSKLSGTFALESTYYYGSHSGNFQLKVDLSVALNEISAARSGSQYRTCTIISAARNSIAGSCQYDLLKIPASCH
jgi:hypothetical protein